MRLTGPGSLLVATLADAQLSSTTTNKRLRPLYATGGGATHPDNDKKAADLLPFQMSTPNSMSLETIRLPAMTQIKPRKAKLSTIKSKSKSKSKVGKSSGPFDKSGKTSQPSGAPTVTPENRLIITGVIDGTLSGGLPKAITLYVIANIPDLSAYTIRRFNNGATSPTDTYKFIAGAVKEGDYVSITTDYAAFNTYFVEAPTITDYVALINGDDVIALTFNGQVSDVFGVVGEHGSGTPWDYKDGWAYRRYGSTPSSIFHLDEWSLSGSGALDGCTINYSCASKFPLGTFDTKLIITGVIDGTLSGGKPKAIELFALADIAVLFGYGIEIFNNAATTPTNTYTFLSGTMASAGEYITITSDTTAFGNYFGEAPTITDNAVSFNGDDVIALTFNGQVSDVFGVVGEDGSETGWEYTDGWAYRQHGSTPSSIFQLDEWSLSGAGALDGCTTNDSCESEFPLGTFGTSSA